MPIVVFRGSFSHVPIIVIFRGLHRYCKRFAIWAMMHAGQYWKESNNNGENDDFIPNDKGRFLKKACVNNDLRLHVNHGEAGTFSSQSQLCAVTV